jgi:hypothetical protein
VDLNRAAEISGFNRLAVCCGGFDSHRPLQIEKKLRGSVCFPFFPKLNFVAKPREKFSTDLAIGVHARVSSSATRLTRNADTKLRLESSRASVLSNTGFIQSGAERGDGTGLIQAHFGLDSVQIKHDLAHLLSQFINPLFVLAQGSLYFLHALAVLRTYHAQIV